MAGKGSETRERIDQAALAEFLRKGYRDASLRGIGQGGMQPELEHIVTSGLFQGLFELIIHDVPIETARSCVRELRDFYTAGFAYALRMPMPPYMRERCGSP